MILSCAVSEVVEGEVEGVVVARQEVALQLGDGVLVCVAEVAETQVFGVVQHGNAHSLVVG